MIEVKLPDGTTVRFPEGTSRDVMRSALQKRFGGGQSAQPDPSQAMRDRVAAAKAGTLQASPDSLARAQAADQIGADQMTLAGAPTAAGLAIKATQGLPFVGEYFDEAMGAIGGPQAMQRTRDIQGAMDRQSPIASTAAMIGGGILGSVPLALAAGPAMVAQAPAGLAARVGAGAAAGAVAGGTEGAVSGYGAGNDGDRAASAVERGVIGSALGGAIGGIAPLAGAGLKSVFERVKGRDVSAISRELNVGQDAARTIKAFLEADDFDRAADALRRAGGDGMLADAGPNARALLDLSVQSGGTARRVAADAVEGRAQAANPRLTQMLDLTLGKPSGIRGAASNISKRTAALRQAAYDKAYSTPIDYAGAGRKVEDVLNRVPPRVLARAVQEADEAMIAAGRTNMQIMANIADDGRVTFQQMPNVEQLDFIKRALSEIAQNETDAITGRVTGAGLRARGLAADLRDALGEAAPAYRTATKLGGDKIAEDQALDLGRKLLLPGTTREQVQMQMANASREAKAAARQGLRQYIDDSLANIQRTLGGTETDIREAQKLVTGMSSRANIEKVRTVLGDSAADRLFRVLDEAAAQFETRAAVQTGSQTYARQAGKQMVEDITRSRGREAVTALANLQPGNAFNEIRKALTAPGSDLQRARMQDVLAEVAQALTQKRGPQAQAALEVVRRAMDGQTIKSADAARLSRFIVSSGVLGAYQTGTRSQAQQGRALQ